MNAAIGSAGPDGLEITGLNKLEADDYRRFRELAEEIESHGMGELVFRWPVAHDNGAHFRREASG